MTTSKTIGLVFDPLDVLFFRDGRAFDAAASVGGGLPLPQTLAGAVTTALLRRNDCDFDRLARAVKEGRAPSDAIADAFGGAEHRWIAEVALRGPWLARSPTEFSRIHREGAASAQQIRASVANEVEPYIPVPATLTWPKKRDDGSLVALRPIGANLPGWKQSHHDGLRPLWSRGREPLEPASGFLTAKGLRAFLQGGEVEPGELLSPQALYKFDHRTGIEIDPDRLTAAESKIYGARFLSLPRGIAFYAEMLLPAEAPADPLAGLDTIPLGGEGRRVALRQVAPYAWPVVPAERNGQKPLLLLTTPGLFHERWKPRALDERLAAAAVPGDVPVSGWDLARGGPKPTRFAAAAGSVYFLDQWPPDLPDSLSDEPRDRLQGWGCYLQGVWNDE